MRTFYDAVSPGNIPTTAQGVAGYIDGLYAWKPADWARFPNVPHVRIAVFASTLDGNCLDVERYDATPDQAPDWCTKRRAAGVDPTVYCSESVWPQVRAAFQSRNIPEPHYWIAAYPGPGATIYSGAVAHQYSDPGPFDLSVVADYWPGVDPPQNVVTRIVNVVVAYFKPKPALPAFSWEVKNLQWATHQPADGFWGAGTDKALLAVRAATTGKFPYLVRYVQTVIGTTADGVFGPQSKASLTATVVEVQHSLSGLTEDGDWGPKTEAAYVAARGRLYKY